MRDVCVLLGEGRQALVIREVMIVGPENAFDDCSIIAHLILCTSGIIELNIGGVRNSFQRRNDRG